MITVRVNGLIFPASGTSWSSVDPGGFEACSFTIPNDFGYPNPGDDVKVWDGLQLVWEGRVEEPGDNFSAAKLPGQVSAVGYGARLRDDTMSMVFIDRDLSHIVPRSLTRQVAIIPTEYIPQGDGQVYPDPSGTPGIKLEVSGHITGSVGGFSECFYNAGDGNLISQVQLVSTTSQNLGANWTFSLFSMTNDNYGSSNTELTVTSTTSQAFTREDLANARQWIAFQELYSGGIFVGDEKERWRLVTNIAFIGNHGVTLRQTGAGTDGYYPSDIANYVRSLASNIDEGDVQLSSTFTAIHSTYPDRTQFETIIDDMSKLMGWHWGVWEPETMTATNPRLDFCPRPSTSTAVVERQRCSQITLSKALSLMFNRARVAYSDAFGETHFVTVNLPHPELSFSRTIDLDIGIGTSANATIYGTQILQLSQSDSRAQGTVDLPPYVDSPQGQKPSHYLRAGLDRLQIKGISTNNWLSSVALNTYRVKRVSSQVIGDGVSTTVEVDNGADLIEVLQARLGQAAFGSTSTASYRGPGAGGVWGPR